MRFFNNKIVLEKYDAFSLVCNKCGTYDTRIGLDFSFKDGIVLYLFCNACFRRQELGKIKLGGRRK